MTTTMIVSATRMGKVMLGVFAVLTFGAIFLTINDVGVMEPTLKKADVQGSTRSHVFIGGGHRVK